MTTKISRFPALSLAVAATILATLNSQRSTAFGQGSLTPPGAPGPVMKSLDQIEARTAITNTSGPVTLAQPGAYYLTHNLTVSGGDAITIATNGVTLDLNGFTVSSTAPSAGGTAIALGSGLRNITIANGFIQGGVTNNGSGSYGGSGFGYGIYYPGSAPVNVLVSRVSVSGCWYYGIYLNTGDSTVVESCMVRTVGSYGIFASTIKNSSAIDCGSIAISGNQISDCQGQSSGIDIGISAATALNCYGSSGSGYGLSAGTAQNCYGTSGSGDGLSATIAQNCYGFSSGSGIGLSASTAQNCDGTSGSGDGLNATTAQNCYGFSYGSGTGLYASASATGCYGYSYSGTGLSAYIANSSYGGTFTGIAQAISFKYNMP